MALGILEYKNWTFEVDKELTKQTYENVESGGSDTCTCSNCQNYVAFRENVFPNEIRNLFEDIGIDYKKEVEVTELEKLPNGLHHISGWFHFKGKLVTGEDCKVASPQGGFIINLTKILENFSIGFSKGNDLTFFNDKDHLVQVEFDTNIPWIIDKKLEDS